jgi:hypothetical protein
MMEIKENCRICDSNSIGEPFNEVKKGLDTLTNASRIGRDGIFADITNIMSVELHPSCRLSYTRARDLCKIEKRKLQIRWQTQFFFVGLKCQNLILKASR